MARLLNNPHVGERPGVMAAAQPRELPEVDFMDAALDAYRSNGNGAHLHEDAEDGEEPHTEQIGFAESRRPDWF